MFRLKRHIVTEITEIFFAVIIALILIMVSFQFARLLGEAASGKIVGAAIYKLLTLQTVNLFVLLTPFAFFVAILIGLSKFATDNELIAMKSVGFSDSQSYHALFFMAIPLALVILFLTLVTLPKVLSLTYTLKEQAKKESELSVLQPGSFRSLGSQMAIFVADVDDREFSKFFVWQRNKGTESVIVAKTGKQFEQEDKRYIELASGSRYSWSQEDSQVTTFDKFIGLMPKTQPVSRAERLKSTPTKTLLDNPTLSNQIEFQRRLMPAISILILTLFAPLLVAFNPRENRYGTFVIAILVYALYLNSQYILKAMIEDKQLPIFPGIYTSHLVFLLIIFLWYLWRYREQLSAKVLRVS